MNLTQKLVLLIAGVTVLTMVLFWSLAERILHQAFIAELENRAAVIGAGLSEKTSDLISSEDPDRIQAILNDEIKNHDDLAYIVVIDFQGDIIAHTFDGKVPGFVANHLREKPPAGKDHSDYSLQDFEGRRIVESDVPIVEGRKATFHLGMDESRIIQAIASVKRNLAGCAIAAFAVFSLMTMLLVMSLTRPLEQVSAAMISYGKGDADFSVPKRRVSREAAMVAEAFERMKEDRLRMETELKRSEEKLRSIVSESPDVILIVDREASIQFMNRNLGAIQAQKAAGSRLYDHIDEKEGRQVRRALNVVFRLGRPMRYERPQDGGGWLTVRMSPIRSGEKTELAMIVCTDITKKKKAEEERKNLKEQLLQSQKMEALGALAGGMAHDFNNVLTAIMGNADLGLETVGAGKPGWRELNEILKASRRAKDLTMRLLTYARKEKLNVKPVSANKLVLSVVGMLSHSLPKKIEIKTDLKPGLPAVKVDANQIEQAILNLCTNARDAMPGGGELILETERVRDAVPEGKKTLNEPVRDWCRIRIADTGSGIDPEVRQKIFEPYFTTKEVGKGTGLGLSITYGIIKSHGGRIRVESEPGKGAEFLIYLPFSSEPEIFEPLAVHSGARGKSESILVVDDERIVLDFAKRALKKSGYDPVTVDNGKQAVEIYKDREGKFDLVILDMIMPEMEGRDVFAAMKRINPGIRAILSSGYSIDGQAGELMKDGMLGFVQKPYSIDELNSAVREALKGT